MAKTTRLTQQDLQIYPSQRLTDTPDGGGQMIGTPLTGEDNELFPPVSDVDRTMGSFDARLVYPAVLRADAEPLYGGHFVIAEPPQAKNVSFLAFKALNYGEMRADIMPRIEAYSVPTIESPMTLLGTQLKGSRLVQVYQRLDEPLPVVGQRFRLSVKDVPNVAPYSQYIRVMDVKSIVRTFVTKEGQEFQRRVVTMAVSDALLYDFKGIEYPDIRYAAAQARLQETQVADTASYFGVRPLVAALSKGDAELRVDTIFEKLVPTSTVETAWADQYPVGAGAWIEAAPRQVMAASKEAWAGNIYLHTSVLPGSVELAGYTDNGQGALVSPSGVRLPVSYTDGVIINTRSMALFTVYGVPATYVSAANYTAIISIDDTNQGTEWVPLLSPKPANGSVAVSFLSGGQWYVVKDSGDYILRDEAGNNCGRVTRAGSCVISLPALPDVGSKIVIGWSPLDAFSAVGGAEPGSVEAAAGAQKTVDLALELQSPVKPGSLKLTFIDGQTKTAKDDGKGKISGDVAGVVDYFSGKIKLSGAKPIEYKADGKAVFGRVSGLVKPHVGTITINDDGDLITGTVGSSYYLFGLLMITLRATLVDVQSKTHFFGNDVTMSNEGFLLNIYVYGDGVFMLDGKPIPGASISNGTFSIPKAALVRQGRNISFSDEEIVSGATPITVTKVDIRSNHSRVLAVNVNQTAAYTIISDGLNDSLGDYSKTISSSDYAVDVLAGVPYPRKVIFNSWILDVGGTRLYERGGTLYKNIDYQTGNGTAVGTISAAGELVFADGALSGHTINIVAGIYANADMVIKQYYGRTPAAPIKPQSFTVYAQTGTTLQAAAGADEQLSGDFSGSIDTETGFFEVVGEEPFVPESLRFNVVTQSYIPLDSSIIGIDSVRLPPDGRVPIYRKGDMIVIGNKHKQAIGSAFAAGQTVALERQNIDRLCVIDADGRHVTADKYRADLAAGKLTFADPLDLSAYTMPLSVDAAWEEENRVVGVDIAGRLKLQFGVGRNYPAERTYVSSALIGGDLLVRATEPFAQQTWDKVWSDTQRGDPLLARLNVKDFPIRLTSNGAITQRWLMLFTSDNQFELYGEQLGLVLKADTLTDLAPANPATGKPYFTLPQGAFGGGWAARNCVRFNTFSAQLPVWILRAVQPTPDKQSGRDGFSACLRGNTVIDD